LFGLAGLEKSIFVNPFSLSGFKSVGLRWALSFGKAVGQSTHSKHGSMRQEHHWRVYFAEDSLYEKCPKGTKLKNIPL
jgi:hypothetical protein